MGINILKILAGLGIVILLALVLIGVFWEKLPIRLVLPYLRQQPIAIEGDVQKIMFTGDTAGEQTFFVHLPEGYLDGEQRFRTLYHLHGAYLRESWAEYECTYIGRKVEEAAAAGIIEPMIVVCPVDPDGDRMWSDSFDGQYLASTALLQDLIPHVDATYRTIARRSGRALQGFSMGGFGAVTNGFRAPELFSAIIIWDGALHDWQTLSTSRKSIANKMFGSEAYFDQWSPYAMTRVSTESDPDLFMVVGVMASTRDFASRFKPHLEGTGREFIYHDVACPHSISCQYDELKEDSFAFLADSFARQSAE
jgi:dienelactone hydrolase